MSDRLQRENKNIKWFADDIFLLTEKSIHLNRILNGTKNILNTNYYIKINKVKIKNTKIDNEKIQEIDKFCYVENKITNVWKKRNGYKK